MSEDDTASRRSGMSKRSGGSKSSKRSRASAGKSSQTSSKAGRQVRAREAEAQHALADLQKRVTELTAQRGAEEQRLRRYEEMHLATKAELEEQAERSKVDLRSTEEDLQRATKVFDAKRNELESGLRSITELKNQYLTCCALVAHSFVPTQKVRSDGIRFSDIRSSVHRQSLRALSLHEPTDNVDFIQRLKRFVLLLGDDAQLLEAGGDVPDRRIPSTQEICND
ncbi:hypothetical protein DIPPA_65460 [Diplonema papillatum]|nr:hypothetical protein DIPPA_65460 [Diplonema papillatum]